MRKIGPGSYASAIARFGTKSGPSLKPANTVDHTTCSAYTNRGRWASATRGNSHIQPKTSVKDFWSDLSFDNALIQGSNGIPVSRSMDDCAAPNRSLLNRCCVAATFEWPTARTEYINTWPLHMGNPSDVPSADSCGRNMRVRPKILSK
jgi:hypothetical protein